MLYPTFEPDQEPLLHPFPAVTEGTDLTPVLPRCHHESLRSFVVPYAVPFILRLKLSMRHLDAIYTGLHQLTKFLDGIVQMFWASCRAINEDTERTHHASRTGGSTNVHLLVALSWANYSHFCAAVAQVSRILIAMNELFPRHLCAGTTVGQADLTVLIHITKPLSPHTPSAPQGANQARFLPLQLAAEDR